MPGAERNDVLKELGRMAAERRAETGMTLDDVYDRTRIRLEYLRGIEEGNYTGFPEVVYIKGFVRTYLHLIGAEDLQNDFMAQLSRGQSQKPEATAANILGNASTVPKGFKPASHVWLFLVLVAALLGTGGYVWYAWSNGEFKFENLRWPNFARNGATASFDALETPDLLSLDVASVSQDVIAASSEPAPKPEERPKPSLAIRAQDDVWLDVRIGTTSVFRRTLRKGNVVSWDLPAQARVVYGRPNAARVILNGRDIGPANTKGTKKAETYLYFPDGTYRRANTNANNN